MVTCGKDIMCTKQRILFEKLLLRELKEIGNTLKGIRDEIGKLCGIDKSAAKRRG